MRELSIGRNPDNDIQVEDASVSRRHAVLIISGNEYSVRDIGSANGTYINGMRVNGVSNLKKKDILKVGNALVPWMNHLEMAGYKQETVMRQPAQKAQQQHQQAGGSSGQTDLPNATGGMVCGIIGLVLSLLLFGVVLNIIAIALSSSALGKYRSNPSAYTSSSASRARTGQTLGIIGLGLFGLVLILYIAAIT